MSNTTPITKSNQQRWVLVDSDDAYFAVRGKVGSDTPHIGRADRYMSLDSALVAKSHYGGANHSLAGLCRAPVLIEKINGRWQRVAAKKSKIEEVFDATKKQFVEQVESNFVANKKYEEQIDSGAFIGWDKCVGGGGKTGKMNVGINFTFYEDAGNREFHDYGICVCPEFDNAGNLVYPSDVYLRQKLHEILDRLVAEEKFL